jgi:hypothetical protein
MEASMRSDSPIRGAVFTLDPRTEELLREVAADPSSCLLRVPRREVEEALTRTDYRGLTSTVGLSAAERELLRTARAELAYWLNVVCFRRLTEDEETRVFYSRVADGGSAIDAPSVADAVRGCDGIRNSSIAVDLGEGAALQLLSDALSDHAPRVSVEALAAASLRLAPSFVSRHYALQALVGQRRASAAHRLAVGLTTTSASRTDRAYSHAILGTTLWSLGHLHAARDAYGVAAETMPTHPEFALRALSMAVCCDDSEGIRRWSRVVDAHPNNLAAVSAVTTSIRAIDKTAFEDAAARARRHVAQSATATREVLDAFDRA